MKNIRCAVIGDGAVGKTSLITTYVYSSFPQEYIPTVHDQFEIKIMFENKAIKLTIVDFAGSEDFEIKIQSIIKGTNIFLLCFSLNCPYSLENIRNIWAYEIQKRCPEVPYILVGLKSDLRDSTEEKEINPQFSEKIPTSKGLKVKNQIKALNYIECSSLNYINVDKVFETAIKIIIQKEDQFKLIKQTKNKNHDSKCQIF